VSEHEPAIDLPAVPEAVAAPPFAAPPGERVPDFTLDRPRDPDWYKRAVFYEVLIRGFHDANGDGTGDIKGIDTSTGRTFQESLSTPAAISPMSSPALTP